jgi:hypothetical protein
MPLMLRKIRKARWYQHNQADFPWLLDEDIPADPLGDLVTNDNELSVWQINDDKSNLHRIAAALAANSDDISNLDAEIKRIPEKEILHLLEQAVVAGQIDRTKLRAKIGTKIDKLAVLNKN